MKQLLTIFLFTATAASALAQAVTPTQGPASPQAPTRTQSDTLREVVVTSHRNLVKRSLGKVILNIENNIQTNGHSTFDLLQLGPGLVTSEESGIRLNGK